LDGKERERKELLAYQGLLWLEGRPLEIVVEKALNPLGVSARPKPPVDLVCSVPGGGELLIEIEGTTGAVQVRKGRQLLGYIAEADDPASTFGAIVANPYRHEHPSSRPPARSQVALFSAQLESLATRQQWKLLTTTQLFEWVRRYLNGDGQVADEVRDALGLP